MSGEVGILIVHLHLTSPLAKTSFDDEGENGQNLDSRRKWRAALGSLLREWGTRRIYQGVNISDPPRIQLVIGK